MKGNKEFSDLFGDDFEVTYEDDNIIDFAGTDKISDIDEYGTGPDDEFDDNDDFGNEDEDDFYDREPGYRDSRSTVRRKRSRGVHLAAPIRKGGRTLSRLASAVVRSLTSVLIFAIAAYVTYTFWRASTPYGDIMETMRTGQPSVTLAVYLCVAVLFLIYELISLLWSMTRVRIRDASGSWKEDTGRGLFSFIFVFATSYLAFIFSPFLPEAPEAVYGLKGALEVYGSMHNVLFGLCAAGIVSCIVRKYFG
nr:hypothetical protein [uncultured Mediterraneibacter sp.]